MTDKEYMERYIYEVIRRVPKAHRDEIALELRELIEDMAEEETMEQVLAKLGDPAKFAGKYKERGSYLISPEYYDNYEWVLKIVLACVLASAVLSGFVQGIVQGVWFSDIFADMVGNGISSAIGAFGIVTFIFAVLERANVKVELKKEQEWTVQQLKKGGSAEKLVWTPRQLAPVPDKKGVISRGESVAGIVFIAVFSGILLFAPHLLGAYVFLDNEFVNTIPLLNLEHWNSILPFFLICMFAGFVDEIIRLMKGCYCKVVMVSNLISGAVQIISGFIMLKIMPFFNPSFMEEISREFGWRAGARQDLLFYYGTDLFSNIILLLVCASVFLEAGVTIYKTVRYGTDRAEQKLNKK